jgi:hypothetical protein
VRATLLNRLELACEVGKALRPCQVSKYSRPRFGVGHGRTTTNSEARLSRGKHNPLNRDGTRCVCLFTAAVASNSRQAVEIERRPNQASWSP